MLKYRLFFGTLITILFTALIILGGWLDGSITSTLEDDKPIQATVLLILIAILIIPAQLEFAALAGTKKINVFKIVSILSSFLFASTWYWPQLFDISLQLYLFFLLAFSFLALLMNQYFCYGTSNVLTNCGVSCFSIIYLGLFSGFCLAIRIDMGIWPFLMFVFVVKSADIGAYTAGKLFGKHKFSPKISPGKTWEGMAGAVVFAIIVAVIFADTCSIMNRPLAIVFGLCFAFIGQLGDLAESMIKRDVQQKDSSKSVPGFGGILDIIDSPLVAAPFAYLFLMFFVR